MKFLYQNWSTVIFMGFYESNLFNSDTEYYLNEYMQDEEHPQTYEINFEPYQQAISEYAVELLKDYVINDKEIIKSMKYKGLYSPRYYNYDTDRLNIEIDVNINKLKKWIHQRKSDFNLYLKDNFTSYDGFISYIENNYTCFKKQYKTDKNRCLNVMIEYYILLHIYSLDWQHLKELDNIYDTPYHYALFDNNREYQMSYLIEVTDAA